MAAERLAGDAVAGAVVDDVDEAVAVAPSGVAEGSAAGGLVPGRSDRCGKRQCCRGYGSKSQHGGGLPTDVCPEASVREIGQPRAQLSL